VKDKQELLKQLMISLSKNETEQADKLIEAFKKEVREITAEEVTEVAQKLEDEKVFADTEMHVSIERKVFEIVNSKIPQQDLASFPKGHPIHTFLEENDQIRALVERAKQLKEMESSFTGLKTDWILIARQFVSLNIHYLRKENQLFPFLEKYGFNHPSSMMWSLHDEIRSLAKTFSKAVEDNDEKTAQYILPVLLREAGEMTVKEEKVLFPTSVRLLSEDDWKAIREGEDEIGYCLIEPPSAWSDHGQSGSGQEQTVENVNPVPFMADSNKSRSLIGGINLDVGTLTPEQINLMFKHMPFDVTYVNEFDEVLYYNKGDKRVFPRSPGIIGRQVKYCHPPKSVHIVEKIIAAFKRGEKDEANFWVDFGGKLIYIQYFAVRDDTGSYKGVLEITYDTTTVRSLEGEKRLLDWK
jgi:DUF438 domain-containing protein